MKKTTFMLASFSLVLLGYWGTSLTVQARDAMKMMSCCPASPATSPATAPDTQPTTQKAVYVCPMDSDVVSDKPGKCPKCGMDLVKK